MTITYFGIDNDKSRNTEINGGNVDWATVHDGDGDYLTMPYGAFVEYISASAKFRCVRSFLFFDTTAIPADAVIISARILMSYDFIYQDDGGTMGTVHIVQSVADDSGTTVADHKAHVSMVTSGGSIAFGDWVIAARDTPCTGVISLNATGLGWIVKGGITKFCLRCQADIDDTPPGTSPPDGYSDDGATGTQGSVTNKPMATIAVATNVKGRRATLNTTAFLPCQQNPVLEVTYNDGNPDVYPKARFEIVCPSAGTTVYTDWQTGLTVVRQAVTAVATGLKPETQYKYRLNMDNGILTNNSSYIYFTTLKGNAGNIHTDQLIHQRIDRMKL